MTKIEKNEPKLPKRKNWSSLRWWKEVYREKVFSHFLRRDATYIVNEEWDNLIILDACRYDAFHKLNSIDGVLQARVSGGSESLEFLVHNFANNPEISDFSDIVYVTANPFVNYAINEFLVPNTFHRVLPIWSNGWDDKLNTVPPQCVADEALKAREQYPDKRLIIHFMQPHFPSLTRRFGDTGFKENRSGVLGGKTVNEWKDTTVEDLLERGHLRTEEVVSAYEENLLIVLAYVKDLVSRLPGRTVVTSDHGEMFGERPPLLCPFLLYPFRVFGHPGKFHIRQLVTVPWLIVAAKELTCEGSFKEPSKRAGEDNLSDEEKVKERLQKLGYL
jgi:sulfur carrier protein ThiS